MQPVKIVGAGPGDIDLITVRGLKAVQHADVILYDRLINQELLTEAKTGAELIYCGKQPGNHVMQQEEINNLLCSLARAGKAVTRLKGGDPFVFGRGGEEAQALSSRSIPFEIVPGITSGVAAPAYAGIPVTHRDYSSSVTFITGVRDLKDEAYWHHLTQSAETLCIYMGVAKLSRICETLIRHGKDQHTPAALIQWGTTSHQKTITGTLKDISEGAACIEQPAMIVIGEVVKLRQELQWFEHMPVKAVVG
ncbi:uroporphyrinogen-III C-methyltransferase [Alkalicoccus daliensis]|uniref:Uroporphyrinogen-III C-methyltransferase n=1 Tax=Alkalicoccus daliensis TaxID=745820 RepID=A0A1H0KQ76_9BACI|nr:uroporphyrinogen-III C-methyltransferase [Alkalicoccus daliensis]SDO58134.1 uroporphyrin-III C-methyltransferase [Alkalicoccus daliensis]